MTLFSNLPVSKSPLCVLPLSLQLLEEVIFCTLLLLKFTKVLELCVQGLNLTLQI